MLRHHIALFGLIILPAISFSQTWEKAKSDKRAQLNLLWYTSAPFIYQDGEGDLIGIEYELMKSFRDFLWSEYNIDLHLNWIIAEGFLNILGEIKDSPNPNNLGVSAFSITKERREVLLFTDAYLPDVAVLVTSQGTPIVQTYNQLNEMLRGMEAVSIKGTSYEMLLLDLKSQLNLDFNINYIDSDKNILDHIRADQKHFGFIDLPIYLLLVRNGGELVRQNLFTSKGTGYGFIMPRGSDWNIPFNEFLADPDRKEEISSIFSKYLGDEIFEFLQKLSRNDQLGTSILTKEKELQLSTIRNANLKLQKEESTTRLLIYGMAVVLISFLAMGKMYFNIQKTTKLLLKQNEQIEKQQEDIEHKNEQLVDRNAQLMTLNDEKNNLVKILAHDLRSPLNQIIGLADILKEKKKESDEDDKMLLSKITESSRHLSSMISKILSDQSLEEGQEMVHAEEVDVQEILNDLENRYKPIAEKKDVDLVVKRCEGHSIIETDQLLLLLVLENLVSNAVKFSPGATMVEVACERGVDTFTFKVKDQGPGFTDEDKKKMFNRFQRLSAQPTAGEQSTGLGLSIAKKYVTDLGGEVWVDSEVGAGTVFFVGLPIRVS